MREAERSKRGPGKTVFNLECNNAASTPTPKTFPSGFPLPLFAGFPWFGFSFRPAAFVCLIGGGGGAGPPAAGSGGGRRRRRRRGGGWPGGRGGGSVPVVTAHVVSKSMPVTLPAVGTVEAISTVQIRAQVTGQLSAIHFAEGQDVQKGQPLFSLDPRPFQAALQQAEAVLARDAATLQNAQAQQTRGENLFQRGLIPRDQYESQRASAAALAATVAADTAAIESARLNLQYADIRAPISGRTGTLGVHAGDLVRANDTIPLIVINQLSPVYVTFSVPGRYLTDIRRYQARTPLPVSAVAPEGSTRWLPGPQSRVPRRARVTWREQRRRTQPHQRPRPEASSVSSTMRWIPRPERSG